DRTLPRQSCRTGLPCGAAFPGCSRLSSRLPPGTANLRSHMGAQILMDRRRILILFAAAWISAGLLTWFLYAKTIAPKPERRTSILAASHDLMVGATIHKTDLKTIALLSKDLPKGALSTEKQALNRVALYPVTANQPLIDGSL